MATKRSFTYTDPESDFSPPHKRAKRLSFPQTPAPTSCSSATRPRQVPTTPYTPYPPHPSDSPSNPFKSGGKRITGLPSVTSFSKHIALRFQLERVGGRPRAMFERGGTHRVVQVPLNYTFTHLRALVAFLFAGGRVDRALGKGMRGDENAWFEVMMGVEMESPLMSPGVIRSGRTSVKVRGGRGVEDEEEEDELSSAVGGDDDEENEEEDDWVWENEEEYTLGHVWNTGVQADRGIIYHHTPSTRIHITANTTKLPRRRGKSNVPFVFSARGDVSLLAAAPLPRPVFAHSILHALSSSPSKGPVRGPLELWSGEERKRKRAEEEEEEDEEDDEEDEDGDEKEEQEEENDADEDAEGDIDDDINPFNENHPFFISQRRGASPVRKKARLVAEPEVIELGDTDESSSSSASWSSTSSSATSSSSSQEKQKQTARRSLILAEDSDASDASSSSLSTPTSSPTYSPSSPSSRTHPNPFSLLISPDRWNAPHFAFGRFLLSFLDPRGRSYAHLGDEEFEEREVWDPFGDDDDEEEEEGEGGKERKGGKRGEEEEDSMRPMIDSIEMEAEDEEEEEDESEEDAPQRTSTRAPTPGLTYTSSSASKTRPSSLPPSSPPAFCSSPALRLFPSSSPHLHTPPDTVLYTDPLSSASLRLSPASLSSLHSQLVAVHYPNTKYAETPIPAGMYSDAARRGRMDRVERRMQRGKRGGWLCEADEVEGGGDGLEGEEERDELQEEGEGEDKWVRPVLKEGEVWDPFGDEVEL